MEKISLGQLIIDWREKLALARDPSEIAIAEKEINRLIKLHDKGTPGHDVFIMHGHDEEMKASVKNFFQVVGLNPLVMTETPGGGKGLLEKIITESGKVVFAVALLSPDDLQVDHTWHSRQNVIFELGYFIGKLGTSRVRMLKKGNTVIPANLHGITYINYDSSGSWKLKLLQELLPTGLAVNLNSLAGNGFFQ